MADAFSLAVNVFTLLEFGRSFAILALDIHKDGKDAVSRIASLDLTSKDLVKISGELGQSSLLSGAHNQDQNEERTHQLVARCIKVAGQMQETISGLGIGPHTGPRKSGNAMAKAFKYKWKQSEIVAFQSEIEDLRSQLMLNLILWLRTGMTKSLDIQDRMIQEFSKIRNHDEGLKVKLDNLSLQQEAFVQQIVQIVSSDATSVVQTHGYDLPRASFTSDLVNAMNDSAEQMEEEDVARLQLSAGRLGRVRKQFIDIFRYDSMFDREAGMAEAHTDTLEWIFKDPSEEMHTWDNFRQWLETKDQIYWITGKMGSGKSTLIKYVSQKVPMTSTARMERRCASYLRRWAQDRQLFVATFYFWAGSNEENSIQTSVEGLYRTLLTQILEAYPEAGPHVSPRRWVNICLFNKDWKPLGIKELKNTLIEAIKYVSSKAKVCLFIDGLDEFEGDDDDLRGLITWIKTLVDALSVKLCVASRPWRVFEDALQDRPHLLMENFNCKDIQQYVERRFHDDPHFRAKKQMETALCNQLVDEIVSRAEGVFLWVNLVCTRLLQAMSRGDLAGDLMQIFNALPVQLGKLYGNILEDLDFKDHAARYFLLLQACFGRPNALIFSFADDISADPEFSLKIREKAFTDAELQYRLTELRKRLNSRCKGLLSVAEEARRLDNYGVDKIIVQYCHRSAKDYFTMNTVQKKLMDMLDEPFDPHLSLCSAHLARWKSCGRELFEHEQHTSIYHCAEHAEKVAIESADMMIRIFDDFDPDLEDLSYIYDERFARNPWFGGNFLSFAVALGVGKYVRHKIGRGQSCIVRSSSVHINGLMWTCSRHRRFGLDKTQRGCGRRLDFERATQGETVEWPLLLDAFLSAAQPDPKMVSLLLENGADPDLIVRCADWKESALSVVLSRAEVKDTDPPDAKKAWVHSLRLLLQYGAKPGRSDMQFLGKLFDDDVVHEPKMPHLGRHRDFITRLLSYFDST